MAQGHDTVASWSGLGAGTDKQSFLDHIRERVPDIDAEEAAEAVFCILSQRISGGTATRLLEELPADAREIFRHCERHSHAAAPAGDKDDFYLGVAEHLLVDPESVRLIIHGVFRGIHTQITEAEAERIESELPRDVASTWMSARHDAPAPH